MIDHQGPTREQRYQAFLLIDKKLCGQNRKDAIFFVKVRRRKSRDVQNLIDRLAKMPDLVLEAHPRARLTDKTIVELRTEYWRKGVSGVELSKRYKISDGHVSRIVHGKTRVAAGGPTS